MRKFFAIFAWLEIILGLAMLWMTFDVGLRATGPFFGALIVLIGIVLLYGLLIYALVGWFIDRQHWPWYVITLVVTLIYNVLAWSFPKIMVQRWATYPFPMLTLIIGCLMAWIAWREQGVTHKSV